MKKELKYAFYLVPVLLWVILYFGFSFNGLYGQDAYEYLRYTENLKMFFLSGKSPGDYFWGIYYPVLGSIISFIIPNIALALQLISVCSLIIATRYAEKIISLLYPEIEHHFLFFLFFTTSPIVLIHSVLVMSDMLCCCLTVTAIYFMLCFIKKSGSKYLLSGVVLSGFAVLTRYAAIVILVPFAVASFIVIINNKKYLILIYSFLLLFIVAIPHLIIRSQNSLQFLSHQWLQTWQMSNIFKSNFITPDGIAENHFINLIYIFFSFFHPIFMFFGSILIIIFLFKRNFQINYFQKLILASIILYAVFLGGIPFQNKRFLLLSFPMVIVLLFSLFHQWMISLKYKKVLFASIFLVQILLTAYFFEPFYQRNCLEKTIAVSMKPYQNQTLYVFDIDIALQGMKLRFSYKNLFLEKYTDFQKQALVLINEKQIMKQWQGKNPGLNLRDLRKKYHLRLLKNFPEDWKLYQIQSKIN